MRLSEKGIQFIRSFEQCRLVAYPDEGGIWTIGWGHTGPEVKEGLIWTQQQADDAFGDDLIHFEAGVSQLVKVPLTQNEFDALVSFAFNVGLDQDEDTKAEGLGDSTLLRKLNDSDYEGAAQEFLKWCHVGGQISNGLKRRRLAEKRMFESEI